LKAAILLEKYQFKIIPLKLLFTRSQACTLWFGN